MKFLFVKREPLSLPDGISQFLFAVSDALIRLGHEVICVTTSDDKLTSIPKNYDFAHYPKLEAMNVSGYETRPQSARRWLRQGRAFVNRFQPDVVILNGAVPVRFAQPTALIAHDVQARRVFLGDLGRILFKAGTYRLADQLVTTCPELVEPVAKECWMRPERFRVIPTCIDISRYQPRPLAQRQPVILHFGFHEYKNPRLTLAAFAAMQNRTARLVLIGNLNADPSVQTDLAALPADLRQRIELPGVITSDRLKEWLVSARVVSVPSQYVIPVASPTVLEALAAHTPAVVSDGISRIVAQNGKNCFVETTAAGMAKRFDELIGQDAVWQTMAEGCAQTKTQFDSLTVAAQFVHLAQEMTRRK